MSEASLYCQASGSDSFSVVQVIASSDQSPERRPLLLSGLPFPPLQAAEVRELKTRLFHRSEANDFVGSSHCPHYNPGQLLLFATLCASL